MQTDRHSLRVLANGASQMFAGLVLIALAVNAFVPSPSLAMDGPTPLVVDPAPRPTGEPAEKQSNAIYADTADIKRVLHRAYGEIRTKGLLSLVKSVDSCYKELPDNAGHAVERCVAMDYLGHVYSARLVAEGVPMVDYFENGKFLRRLLQEYLRSGHDQQSANLSMVSIEGMAREIIEDVPTASAPR